MTIPDYQEIMLPLLRLTEDGREHPINEIFEKLGSQFNLTDDERNELLPSGRQKKFENRVHWAKTYLQKSCLLESTGRAKFKITTRGKDVLSASPSIINNAFLSKFPEFVEFRRRNSRPNHVESIEDDAQGLSKTPLEILEEGYENLNHSLAQELLETIKNCPPRFFENLVVDLLIAMGYGGSRLDAGSAIGRTGDGGVDGIIKEDKLGLDIIYLQAKRWEGTIGAPDVQAFAGSLEGFRARKGIFLTTSTFSSKAREYIDRIEKKIILIDGKQLAQLMIEHGVGVTEMNHYIVRRIDKDYFEVET